MLNENADKEYLAGKVAHYFKQGDIAMAHRFLHAYLPIVGGTRDEIMEMAEQLDKTKKNVKRVSKKGDEE